MDDENEFIHRMGWGDFTTCVYQFIFDKGDIDKTHIIQYVLMHGLGLCIKIISYVAPMFCIIAHSQHRYTNCIEINK